MSATTMHQLFVYGSLRSGFQSPAYEYISRYFHLVGEAKVKGKLYDMGSYPAGIPAHDDNFIIGELYELNDPDEFHWAFAQLDDYEGVTVESDEIQLYRREIAEVHTQKGIIQAWIYWYNRDIVGKPLIASGDLIQYMHEKK